MLFRKNFFKRSSQYLPQQTDEILTKKGKAKKNKILDKSIQILKMCRTVKSGGCNGQRVFHEVDSQTRQSFADKFARTETGLEICPLKNARLACLARNNLASFKSPTQIYNERRSNSQLTNNAQFDHPAFRSSLFTGLTKTDNRKGRNKKSKDLRIRGSLPCIQECEDEHLYDS